MDPKRVAKLWPWLLSLSLVLFAAAAGFAEEEKKDQAKPPEKAEQKADKAKAEAKEAEEVKVYTNEDLEKLTGPFGPIIEPVRDEDAQPAETPQLAEGEQAQPGVEPGVRPTEPKEQPEAAQPTDPLEWMEQRKARQAEHQRQLAQAEQAVADAKKKVADLEYRLRATRVPFLARPEIPEDEREAWSEKTAPERAELTQKQLDEARAELAKAEQALAQLRAQTP